MNTIKQKLLNSITTQLDYFFDDIDIYSEHIPQNFSTPCFTIKFIKYEEQVLLAGRYKLFNTINIQYYDGNSNDISSSNLEYNLISSKLFDCMRRLSFDHSSILGQNLSSSIEQNILNFYIDYDFYIFKKKKAPLMQNLIQ